MKGRARSPLVAAVDLGTNTVLLLVARLDEAGRLQVVEDRCEGPRLGAGLAATGRLDGAAAARALDVLERYARRAAELGVPREHLRVVGTAVLRRAADAGPFIARARARAGFAVEVLSEEAEARLSFAAVVGDGGDPSTLVIDSGGGSTELVGEAGRLRLSAPIGAVVLTETYLGDGQAPPLLPGGWAALERSVAAAVRSFPAGLAAPPDRAPPETVCLGGSASNLACLDQGLGVYDEKKAEGHRFAAQAASLQARRLQSMDSAARLRLPIEASRVSILPAGLWCIAATLERIGARSARVSGRGLRYGVARELLG
ncbi:MAG: hypothetical protein HY812_13475 [Planctomycetes bacterium]|nr:hypothetical protein [Planctomycetota bacterium]